MRQLEFAVPFALGVIKVELILIASPDRPQPDTAWPVQVVLPTAGSAPHHQFGFASFELVIEQTFLGTKLSMYELTQFSECTNRVDVVRHESCRGCQEVPIKKFIRQVAVISTAQQPDFPALFAGGLTGTVEEIGISSISLKASVILSRGWCRGRSFVVPAGDQFSHDTNRDLGDRL